MAAACMPSSSCWNFTAKFQNLSLSTAHRSSTAFFRPLSFSANVSLNLFSEGKHYSKFHSISLRFLRFSYFCCFRIKLNQGLSRWALCRGRFVGLLCAKLRRRRRRIPLRKGRDKLRRGVFSTRLRNLRSELVWGRWDNPTPKLLPFFWILKMVIYSIECHCGYWL